jgi:hypothetical protein
VDINTEHIHLIKLFPSNKNALILNKPQLQFKHVTQLLNKAEDDDKMLDVVLLKFELVDDNNTTCLKNLIVKYKDTYVNYQNTLKNILLFNNISYDEKSTINIKMMRNKKMTNINKSLSDVHDYHINHILYFL